MDISAREAEVLAALSAALREHRLVTAVGPGGVGKTRLALSVAADVGDRFADGVWYVDLVRVTDAAMIAPAIADALGLGERQGSTAADIVVGWLADRETLLVLDNCEHLLDGVVVLLERLLAGSPRSAVLATSRARLLVPFERVFMVPGLSVEAAGGDAVELFRGRVAAGGGALRPADTERIAAVCRSLDGMALAIELAAARYPSLGLDGLEGGLTDRLRLLTGGPRLNDRHRSLRSTLDWSYALLDGPDQAVLRRASVFADPFPVTTAAASPTTPTPRSRHCLRATPTASPGRTAPSGGGSPSPRRRATPNAWCPESSASPPAPVRVRPGRARTGTTVFLRCRRPVDSPSVGRTARFRGGPMLVAELGTTTATDRRGSAVLLDTARAGDEHAWGELVSRHTELLWSVVRSRPRRRRGGRPDRVAAVAGARPSDPRTEHGDGLADRHGLPRVSRRAATPERR